MGECDLHLSRVKTAKFLVVGFHPGRACVNYVPNRGETGLREIHSIHPHGGRRDVFDDDPERTSRDQGIDDSKKTMNSAAKETLELSREG
jgi:hypothetical protein